MENIQFTLVFRRAELTKRLIENYKNVAIPSGEPANNTALKLR